jgi:hypothetical protein
MLTGLPAEMTEQQVSAAFDSIYGFEPVTVVLDGTAHSALVTFAEEVQRTAVIESDSIRIRGAVVGGAPGALAMGSEL